MTHNQIEYANYKESKRHNIAGETELNRHNVVTEYETARHNVETENIGWANLSETKRHNQADEVETHRYHTANESIERSKLSETTRHNKVSEQIDSYRAANEIAIGYQNASTNAYNAQTNRGNMRINEYNANTNRKSALAKAHYEQMNAETARFEALQKQKSVSIDEYKARLEKVKTVVNKALTDSTIDKNKAETSLKKYEKYLREAELLVKKKDQKHRAHYDWAKLPAEYIRSLGKVVASAVVLFK